MKRFLAFGIAATLAACGGGSAADKGGEQVQSAPKPSFKVKHLDKQTVNALSLETPETREIEGKQTERYRIKGLNENNYVDLIGKYPEDLEAVNGKCMGTDDAGKASGWAENGVCRTLFAQLVANAADDAETLNAYLLAHSGLSDYQSSKGGYAAVQNGRYILELDREGLFSLRRRHYQ